MGGFPALQIQQPESPLKQFGEAEQIKGMMQQQQMGAIELQNARQSQLEQQTIMQLYRQNQGDLGKTIADATATGKVRPQTLLQLQNQHITMQTSLANLGEKELANAKTFGDMAAGGLDSVLKVPEAERPAALQRVLAGFAANGVPAEQIQGVQKQLSGLPDLSDQTLKGLEASLIGHNKMVENELNTRKTIASEAEAAARGSQAATAAAKVGPEVAHLAAQTKLAQTQEAQAGQVTPKDVYVQNMENYRAALARTAQNANQVQRQGIESLQKQSDSYTQFRSTADSLKNSLAAASNGNEMAAAVAPLQGTLFITTSEGVKRINETELKGVSGAGSLVQRINGALGKATGEGPLSQQLKDDMAKLVDIYTDAKYASYKKQTDYTKKLHGLDPQKTPVLSKDGSIEGEAPTQSAPKMIRARDPQGKLHEAPEGTALPPGWKLE